MTKSLMVYTTSYPAGIPVTLIFAVYGIDKEQDAVKALFPDALLYIGLDKCSSII